MSARTVTPELSKKCSVSSCDGNRRRLIYAGFDRGDAASMALDALRSACGCSSRVHMNAKAIVRAGFRERAVKREEKPQVAVARKRRARQIEAFKKRKAHNRQWR